MSRTFRKNYQNKKVKDKDICRPRPKHDMKKSTKKLWKLKTKDIWNIPNHDKFGRLV